MQHQFGTDSALTQRHQKDPDVTKMSEDFKEEGVEFIIDTGKNSKDETITAFIFGGIPIIGKQIN